MENIVRKYGWKREPIDDSKMLVSISAPHKGLPDSVDLEPKMPAIYNQLQTGSCTGQGIGGAIEYALIKSGITDFTPSRLFIYYNERLIEGDTSTDAGGQIHDGIKGVNLYGIVDEKYWAFSEHKVETKPSQIAYTLAAKEKLKNYAALDNRNITGLKSCLALGYPIVFGFTVYSYFESEQMAKNGILNLPSTTEEILGGHCVLIVGYDDAKQMFKVRNSWGADWGLNGYFWMSYAYVTNTQLSSDFWMIRI